MFAMAKQDHGYVSTFHEDEYTTKLNTNDPAYARRHAEAGRIAGQIISGVGGRHNDNVHVREDRGMATNVNEESKYGAVKDSRYQVPALRKPTTGSKKSDGADGASPVKKTAREAPGREQTDKDLKTFSTDFKLEKPEAGESPVDPAASSEKKDTGHKLNVAAKEFKFNPQAASFSFAPKAEGVGGASPVSVRSAGSPAQTRAAGGMQYPMQMQMPPGQMPPGLPNVMPRGMQPMQQGMPGMQPQGYYPQQMRPMYVYMPRGGHGYPQQQQVMMQQHPQHQMMPGGMMGGPRMPMQQQHPGMMLQGGHGMQQHPQQQMPGTHGGHPVAPHQQSPNNPNALPRAPPDGQGAGPAPSSAPPGNP